MSEQPPKEKKQDAAWDEITRRQWILRLGEAAALVGFSGFAPEIAAALLSDETQYANLPPGLYLPSADMLVHALRSGHQPLVPPPGTETDYVQLSSSPFHPQFFSPAEFAIVTRLTRIILGEVDAAALSQATQWIDLWFSTAAEIRQAARQLDPSHRVLAVAYYGEPAVRDLESADPQAAARDGFSELRKLSEANHGRGFLELDDPEQLGVVNSLRTAQPESAARKFFELVRNQAIHGYFTSAPGIAELDYKGNAYHPTCPGCAATDAHDASSDQNK
jgi:hypothetical protein